MAQEIELATVYYNVEARLDSLRQVAPVVAAADRAVTTGMGNANMALKKTGDQASAMAVELAKAEARLVELKAAFTTMKIAPVGREFDQLTAEVARLKAQLGSLPHVPDDLIPPDLLPPDVVPKTEKAARGLKRVESGLVAIALSATGTAGPVGQLVSGLLTFGAGSAAVLGVAAAIAVLAKGYAMLTVESRMAEEQNKKTRDAIVAVREAAKLPVQVANDLLTGAINARADALERFAKSQRDLAIANATGNAGLQGAALGRLNDAAAELAKTNADLQTARENRASVGRESRAQELRDLIEARGLHIQVTDSVAREADLVKQLRAIESDTSKPLKDRIEARKTLNELAAAERDRARELRDIVLAGRDAAAQMTKDLTDNALVALQRFDAQAQATIAGLPARDRDDAQSALDRQRLLLEENFRAARALDATGPAGSFEDLDRIDEAMVRLIGEQQQLVEGGQAYEALTKRIAELEERKTQIMQGQLTAQKLITDRVDAQQKAEVAKAKNAELARRSLQEQVNLITSAVRGAIQLGQAFGLVGDATARILGDILTLADRLPALTDALDALKDGKGSVAAVIGAAVPVVGAVASIASQAFGGGNTPSPEDEARRRRDEANTRVLSRLADVVGEFGKFQVTGASVASAERAIAAFEGGDFAAESGRYTRDAIDAALKARGSSLEELQQLADGLGLTVDFVGGSVADITQAFKALDAAIKEAEIAKFAETFGGQYDALRLQAELFNKTATQQLQDLQVLIATGAVTEGGDPLGSPAIARALEGLDLNTAEGRAAALTNLQQLSLLLNQENGLSADDMGGLTGDQFAQALRDLKNLIDQAAGEGAAGASSSFSQTRSITEEQFDRQFGLLTTSNVYLSMVATGVQAIQGMLATYLMPNIGIQPPPLSASAGAAGGITLILNGDIQITVVTGTGTEVGAGVGQAVLDALLAELGGSVRAGRAAAGQIGVN